MTGQLDAFVWQTPPSAIGAPADTVEPMGEPAARETPVLVPATSAGEARKPDNVGSAVDPVSAGMTAAALPVPAPVVSATSARG